MTTDYPFKGFDSEVERQAFLRSEGEKLRKMERRQPNRIATAAGFAFAYVVGTALGLTLIGSLVLLVKTIWKAVFA